MMKKIGIAVLFAASMSVATSAHAFFNFGCNYESKVVEVKSHNDVLRGSNLLFFVLNIIRGNFCQGNFD